MLALLSIVLALIADAAGGGTRMSIAEKAQELATLVSLGLRVTHRPSVALVALTIIHYESLVLRE